MSKIEIWFDRDWKSLKAAVRAAQYIEAAGDGDAYGEPMNSTIESIEVKDGGDQEYLEVKLK